MQINDAPVGRRRMLAGAVSALGLATLPLPAFALNTTEAEALINRMVGEINGIINSGRSANAMFGDFEKVFANYADVPTIARTTLGPAARGASASQMSAYTTAFRGYISRKYGKRFREFIGGQIQVNSARKLKSFYEVKCTAILRGSAPFDLVFLVSDKSGRDLFFDMLIEGISLLKSEKTEIGSMLDRRRGDIDGLIVDLRQAS